MRIELLRRYFNSKEYYDKLRQREERLSKPLPELYKNILDIYSVNPIEFIETFGVIKIPEIDSKTYPFFLFDYQKKIIIKLMESELDDGDHEILIDKPRQMGITWVMVWYIIWRWLFKRGWSCLIISRKEDEVDDGTANPEGSIFGKIRWGINNLPDELVPEGFITRTPGKRGTSVDLKLKMINPIMESVIHGSSSAAHSGRSRRYSFIFVDEFFAIENAISIYRALQTVSRIKVFVSTIAEFDPRFEQIKDFIKNRDDYITLTWQDNPFKDEIWFKDQMEKAKFDPEIMREFAPVYEVNPELRYYPEADQAQIAPIEYDDKLNLYASIDIGSRDWTVIVWYQYDGKNIKVLEAFWDRRRELEYYIPLLTKKVGFNLNDYSPEKLSILQKVRNWKEPVYLFGEMAHAQQRMPYNVSDKQIFQKHGIRFEYNRYEGRAIGGYRLRRRSVALILPYTIFNADSEGAMLVLKSLKSTRFVEPSNRSAGKTAYGAPVHDRLADFRASFENFAMNFLKVVRTTPQQNKTKVYSPLAYLFTPRGILEQSKKRNLED